MAPWMALCPPGKGGGEGVARGGQGTGALSHRLTAGDGRPLANGPPPANGDDRAYVLPLLDAIHVRTGHSGRLWQRPKVLAPDQGDAAKAVRQPLRPRGIRAQLPKRVWKTKKPRGRPITRSG